MAQEGQVADLTPLLRGYRAFITYEPLRTEVAWQAVGTLPRDSLVFPIPPRASLDPFVLVAEARSFARRNATVLFVPGRRFDASGTRHGQGGGWYDRFLSRAPREWLRIGFCFTDQFSQAPLVRAEHDEAMDYVLVVDRKTGASTLYSTDGETS